MGIRNFLVEGVSATGKTSVCRELQRRGFHAVNGDTELAYQGDPDTGAATRGSSHENHIWRVSTVEAIAADRGEQATFFCGGSRNFSKFLHLFDAVFVLEVDLETLNARLDRRPSSEWGGTATERALVQRLHQTKADLPDGLKIDATAPLVDVVDTILRRCGLDRSANRLAPGTSGPQAADLDWAKEPNPSPGGQPMTA